MESKLQKPSGLRRPTPISKTILPMDRIKTSVSAFGSKSMLCPDNTKTLQPLTKDLTNANLATGIRKRERASSPDIFKSITTVTRPKLRRSRSACDMRQLKRADDTLPPIPQKKARLENSRSDFRSRYVDAASSSSSNITSNRKKPLPIVKPIVRTAASVTAAKKTKIGTAAAQTSISTTGAGKPISKRIPPYDFKARYNDLLEKHKVIKEKYQNMCEQMGGLENMPEQLEDAEAQLYSTKEELRFAQNEIECLQQQGKLQTIKISTVTENLAKTLEELQQVKEDYSKVLAEHGQLSIEAVELRKRTATLSAEKHKLSEENAICKEQIFHSNIERKELHNTIMDLRGNIRVFCRVRPPLDCEQEKMLCGWNYLDEATVEIQNTDLSAKNKAGAHIFNFDHVFHSSSSQEDVFDKVSPLIQSALDGYNVCIFAYGQTGSGKTYTMDGIHSNVGVIPRTVDLLFNSVKNYARLGWVYQIKVTFLEIYNEVLYDLLSNDQKDMEIRMSKSNKNDIYVSNITEETVSSATRLRQLMDVAKTNRATAATACNERSSRSHAVTKIELIGTHTEKQETSVGTINLVDLAGSESPKTSLRMNETKNINRSLSELTNVILALLQKQDHIPYRNSKLTHLLMPSLGGNSKTLMFINVAPFLECYVESVKSLRFAASVNSCKMAKAKRNRFLNNSSSSGSTDK